MSRAIKSGTPEKSADKTAAGVLSSDTDKNRRSASGAAAEAKTSGAAKDKPKGSDSTPQKEKGRAEVSENPPKRNVKKSAPKAAGAKSSKKIVDEKAGSGSRTPQVMKLVEPQGDVNPVIIAGKSRIPRQLRGRAPLSRIMRREAAEIFGDYYTDPNELLTVNLTELVIKENAGELLRRFNACCCDKCIEELSRRAIEKVPSRFARVTRAVLEQGAPELEEQKEPLKKSALSAMIRELIGNKRRHFHS